MPSPSSQDDVRIRQLQRRIEALESQLAGLREITGVCTSAPALVVPVLSVYFGTDGLYVIRFSSVPGDKYQVQTSTGMLEWTVANGGAVVDATDGQAYTEWISTDTWELDELPVYFRVRRHPQPVMACIPSTPVCR